MVRTKDYSLPTWALSDLAHTRGGMVQLVPRKGEIIEGWCNVSCVCHGDTHRTRQQIETPVSLALSYIADTRQVKECKYPTFVTVVDTLHSRLRLWKSHLCQEFVLLSAGHLLMNDPYFQQTTPSSDYKSE